MSISDIAYVEIYVSDLDGATGYLVDGVGFTTIATGRAADRSSAVLRAGGATVVLTAPVGAGPVADFVDTHGDGVADIALTCADLDEVRRLARAAGFLTPDGSAVVVPELEPVRHSLLAAGEDWTRQPFLEPVALSGDGVAGPPLDIDHLALCLRRGELEAASASYQKLGLDPFFAEYIEVGNQAMDSLVVRSDTGGATLTMVTPAGADSGQLAGFLARNAGPGVQHIALTVTDLVATVADLRSRDIRLLPAPEAYYDVLRLRGAAAAADAAELRGTGILADSDEFGELRQIFAGSPFPRDTLFLEFIERRGAQSFGTRNIRALYEAKDAEARVTR